jgi:hypothetical protein
MAFYRKALWFYRGWQEYTNEGFLEAEKKFNPQDLDVNLKGKSYIITGKNNQIFVKVLPCTYYLLFSCNLPAKVWCQSFQVVQVPLT